MKMKIYIMHSDKINYKEELYKPLLKLGLMKDYYLILPMSEKYISEYIKTIIEDSDIVICNLTKMNFFLKAELKWAIKLKKDIYYFIDINDKNVKKYKNIKLSLYQSKEELCEMIKTFLDSLDKKSILLKRENIYCLGKIQK